MFPTPVTGWKIRSLRCSNGGFSGVELLAAMIIVSILSTMAVAGIAQYKKKACRVVLEHDVRKFIEAETAFYSEHDRIAGHVGGIISNDPARKSTFWLANYLPSQNTSITIVNEDPLIITGSNRQLLLTFECDIVKGTLTER